MLYFWCLCSLHLGKDPFWDRKPTVLSLGLWLFLCLLIIRCVPKKRATHSFTLHVFFLSPPTSLQANSHPPITTCSSTSSTKRSSTPRCTVCSSPRRVSWYVHTHTHTHHPDNAPLLVSNRFRHKHLLLKGLHAMAKATLDTKTIPLMAATPYVAPLVNFAPLLLEVSV